MTPGRGMAGRRRLPLLLAVLAVMAMPVVAAASTYGAPPLPGNWVGASSDGITVKFRVDGSSTHLSNVVVRVPYSCRAKPGAPLKLAGRFVGRSKGKDYVDPAFGDSLRFRIFFHVHALPGRTYIDFQPSFSAHHPVSHTTSGKTDMTTYYRNRQGEFCRTGTPHGTAIVHVHPK